MTQGWFIWVAATLLAVLGYLLEPLNTGSIQVSAPRFLIAALVWLVSSAKSRRLELVPYLLLGACFQGWLALSALTIAFTVLSWADYKEDRRGIASAFILIGLATLGVFSTVSAFSVLAPLAIAPVLVGVSMGPKGPLLLGILMILLPKEFADLGPEKIGIFSGFVGLILAFGLVARMAVRDLAWVLALGLLAAGKLWLGWSHVNAATFALLVTRVTLPLVQWQKVIALLFVCGALPSSMLLISFQSVAADGALVVVVSGLFSLCACLALQGVREEERIESGGTFLLVAGLLPVLPLLHRGGLNQVFAIESLWDNSSAWMLGVVGSACILMAVGVAIGDREERLPGLGQWLANLFERLRASIRAREIRLVIAVENRLRSEEAIHRAKMPLQNMAEVWFWVGVAILAAGFSFWRAA